MIFKNYELRLLARVALLFLTLLVLCLSVIKGWYEVLIVDIPLNVWVVIDMLRHQKKMHTELRQFAESVRYRDFSRHFDVKDAPAELKQLRKGFNDITSTFKAISRERETQYQYLQKILELVDTGILSYEIETGEIGWLNESFKRTFHIPYLKTIDSLRKRYEDLYTPVVAIKPGETQVVVITWDKQVAKILLAASVMRSDNKVYKLLAFRNISEALDETESKAWQKLLNVMTHEIMNSVAPISSLADTLKNRLQNYNEKTDRQAELDDLELGIDTIKRRSEGLLKFTERYRNLNKITQLALKQVLVLDLFENLSNLMQPTLLQKNIELDIVLRDTQMIVNVDLELIEQVLINLLVNAIEAVKTVERPVITLSGELLDEGRPIIKIGDNGTGMSPELMDKIFIPFFSTRKSGSGIGLSLCKQIVMLHKGTIKVQSAEKEGSIFTIQLS